MSGNALVLRCKTKSGNHVLNTLTGENTVSDLKSSLRALTGIPPSRLRILTGFPPKPLNLPSDLSRLDALPLNSGDTLIIEEDTSAKTGILIRRPVPANNSCLFTSVYFAASSGDYNPTEAAKLRKLIADTVTGDKETYNEVFLGRTNSNYARWIQNDESWGGAIELAILSKHYRMEIVAVDTQNTTVMRFGEDCRYDDRILVIYDGIHYDPLLIEEADGSTRTIFPTSSEIVLQMALEIAAEAKATRQFTDVQNFTLRCLVCNMNLTGQSQAQVHAKETGHINFGEM